jgi:hypothetical protein
MFFVAQLSASGLRASPAVWSYAHAVDFTAWWFVPTGMLLGAFMPVKSKPRIIEAGANVIGCGTIGACCAVAWPIVIAGSVSHAVKHFESTPNSEEE